MGVGRIKFERRRFPSGRPSLPHYMGMLASILPMGTTKPLHGVRMRSFAILLSSFIIAGCAGEVETDGEVSAGPEAAAPASVADFAGTWQSSVTLEGVADPVPSTMTGSASGTDWTMSLEGRDPIPLQLSMSGDSLITQSAEYESILRPGVMTVVRSAVLRQGDSWTGPVVVTYRTAAGEEVVRGVISGTRTR